MPPDPTKDGAMFDGWYWDEHTWRKPFTANSLLNAPLSKNMSVYAKWKTEGENEVQTYTITFNSNGGDNVAQISAKSGDTISAPTAPSKASNSKWEEYEFLGWYTDNETFTKEFTFGTMPNFNNTLYAKWELVDVWEAISSQDGLKDLDAYGNYYLTSNITLTGNWVTIDHSDDAGFHGKFDGKGHKITGLKIVSSQNVNVGGFMMSNAGIISNLTLDGVDITVSSNSVGAAAGGIAVYNHGGNIINCYVHGKIVANGHNLVNVGGIVAENKGIITDSHTDVDIEANSAEFVTLYSNIGGAVGRMTKEVTNSGNSNITARLENCSSVGDIIVNTKGTTYVGGLIGSSYGKVLTSLATGSISVTNNGDTYVGGLMGINEINAEVKNCYATGNVQVSAGRAFVGGFVGKNDAVVNYGYATGNVTSVSTNPESYAGGFAGKGRENTIFLGCLAMGNVSAATVSGFVLTGGFVANANSTTINSCYYYENQIVTPDSSIITGIECSDEDLGSHAFYTNSLKFAIFTAEYEPTDGVWVNVWVLPAADGELPELYWQE